MSPLQYVMSQCKYECIFWCTGGPHTVCLGVQEKE